MDLKLSDKRAIITGGSAGIGLSCAEVLVKEGARVVIAARDADRLNSAVTHLNQMRDDRSHDHSSVDKGTNRAFGISADITRVEDIKKVVQFAAKTLGGIDILINNAGSAVGGVFADLADGAFLDAWQLKLLGYIRMVQAVLPYMKQQRDGRVVNIIGGAARNPSATFLPGGTANAAILNFTRGLAPELARSGIRMNAISPGGTATERAKRLAAQAAKDQGISVEKLQEKQNSTIPIGRLVNPTEIGWMAAFLSSDLAASTVGAEVVIDGGSSRSL